MPASDILQPRNPEFDHFLQASVGEDRNGNTVTVLSTLARLDLEPWEEADALSALKQEAAVSRLEKLLLRFRDVPALRQKHGQTARKLTLLLPKRRERLTTVSIGAGKGLESLTGLIWVALTILFLILQYIFSGSPGTGE